MPDTQFVESPTIPPMASDLYRINYEFSIRFDLRDGRLNCEWTPRAPNPHEKVKLLGKYRRVRDEFLAAYAASIGATVGCLEMDA